MSNQAAWISAAQAPTTVGPAEMYSPGPHEILVKNACIAFSPFEAKLQKFAFIPITYPANLGMSCAGTVTEVGPEVTEFHAGDHVVVNRSMSKLRDARYGAYQRYLLADTKTTSRLDPSTSFQDAAATILNLATVVSALGIYMKLDRPPLSGKAASNGNRILVYGGSSSVGSLAVQYATSAGYTVVTTSSPKNMETVSQFGAAHIIDHTQPPEALLAEIRSHGPYDGIFDAIGNPPVTELLGKLLAEKGGVWYSTTPSRGLENLPQGVERKTDSYPEKLEKEENSELGTWFYKEYLPKSLAEGAIKPGKLEKVEGGLEAVQGALDRLMSVSGVKLVLDLEN